jgi:hypothetical protein
MSDYDKWKLATPESEEVEDEESGPDEEYYPEDDE